MKSYTIIRTCKVCGNEFPFVVEGAGRQPELCSAWCKRLRRVDANKRYRETEKGLAATKRAYRVSRENYNPWLWENTILEWDE